MAKRATILRYLKKLRNLPRVAPFIDAHPRLQGGSNPTEHLAKTGVGIGFLTLQSKTCDNILEHVISLVEKKQYTTDVEGLSRPKQRLDVEIPPRGYCWNVLQRILSNWKKDKGSPWHRFRQPGVEPRLVEFSVLGSLPGSANQVWHKDHWSGYGKLISFGIPLIDVQDEHGPTQCILRGLPEKKYKRKPFRVRAKKGQLYAWDGGMTHRGTQNNSKVARPIFMFSLCFSEKIPTKIAELSLHSDLKNRLLK